MSIAYTFLFNEIFPTYNDWKTFIQQNSSIIDYENPEHVNFDKYCWNILSRHFSHANIRYLTINEFEQELLNVYENKFEQFMQEKKIIDELHKMSFEELASLSETLSNFARNPNETNDIDSTGKFTFISEQTYNKVNSNKFEAYLKALNNLPSLNYYKFIEGKNGEMGFKDLFMNVIPNIKILFDKGEN